MESSLITWDAFTDEYEGKPATIYCADGDGIVVVVKYDNGAIELRDQGDFCATFDSLPYALEQAQRYLAATYNDIFQAARNQ